MTERTEAIESPPLEVASSEVIAALLPFLKDDDDLLRLCAAETLGRYRSPESVDALREFVRHEREPLAKAYGLSSLGRIGDESDIPLLLRESRASNPQLQAHALVGIFEWALRCARDGLLHIFEVSDDVHRSMTVHLMAEILSPRYHGDIVEVLRSKRSSEINPAVRDEITSLIETIESWNDED